MKPPRSSSYGSRRGVTLAELLLLVCVVAFLLSIAVPALSKTKPHNFATQCLSNQRQLLAAWQMYADESEGKLVPNYWGASPASGVIPWAQGWLDWTTAPVNTNVAMLVNGAYAQLGRYYGKQTNLLKCPADKYLSSVQRTAGWSQRVRSVSMAVGIGQTNVENGPWDPTYKSVTKMSEFLIPAPADTWVFLEEHPDSINEVAFFSPTPTIWVDMPANYHLGGACFGFADGHAELHRWTASMMKVRQVQGSYVAPTPAVGDADVHWLSWHSSRVSTNSF